MEHIQLVHNLFYFDFLHTIKFWNFGVGINNQKIIRKSCVTCQNYWCCWWNYIHKFHLKGAFGFSGILDLAFSFIEEIWYDVQKGSRYIISSISPQTLSVSPAKNDLVDLWPNLWCNNYRAIFFLAGNFFIFDIYFISPRNKCLLCALCGNVTAFISFSLKYTVKNPFWNKCQK